MMRAFKQPHFSMLYIIYRAVEVSLQHDSRLEMPIDKNLLSTINKNTY
jgi:hypothetical protein